VTISVCSSASNSFVSSSASNVTRAKMIVTELVFQQIAMSVVDLLPFTCCHVHKEDIWGYSFDIPHKSYSIQ